MMDGFSFDSSFLYIGQGGAQQPPKPSLTPKEGPETNLGELWVKIATSRACSVKSGTVRPDASVSGRTVRSDRCPLNLLFFCARARHF